MIKQLEVGATPDGSDPSSKIKIAHRNIHLTEQKLHNFRRTIGTNNLLRNIQGFSRYLGSHIGIFSNFFANLQYGTIPAYIFEAIEVIGNGWYNCGNNCSVLIIKKDMVSA